VNDQLKLPDPSRSTRNISRREWLGSAAAATAAVALGPKAFGQETPTGETARILDVARPRKRVLRLAHLTDLHVQPELAAEKGMVACLHHVQSLEDPPTLLLTGGDSVMDVMAHDAARAAVQAEIWRRVLKNECSLPVRSCIGNHDVWGWTREESKTAGNEPLWGKQWGEDLLGLSNRYYHFDTAGWRFIVLDSTFPKGSGYTARLDDEQFDWLFGTLAETPRSMPVLVLSHIPILSAAAFFDGKNEEKADWNVPGAWMHIDARRIKDLFLKHPNVKLCLSGHLHLVDQVLYNGVTYCCNGAVCGAWWEGSYQECAEGYALVDLFDDGSLENRYVTFGWQAVG